MIVWNMDCIWDLFDSVIKSLWCIKHKYTTSYRATILLDNPLLSTETNRNSE